MCSSAEKTIYNSLLEPICCTDFESIGECLCYNFTGYGIVLANTGINCPAPIQLPTSSPIKVTQVPVSRSTKPSPFKFELITLPLHCRLQLQYQFVKIHNLISTVPTMSACIYKYYMHKYISSVNTLYSHYIWS